MRQNSSCTNLATVVALFCLWVTVGFSTFSLVHAYELNKQTAALRAFSQSLVERSEDVPLMGSPPRPLPAVKDERLSIVETPANRYIWSNYTFRMTVPDTIPSDYREGGFPDPRVDALLGKGQFPVVLLGQDKARCQDYMKHHPKDGEAWLDLRVNGEILSKSICRATGNALSWSLSADYAFMALNQP